MHGFKWPINSARIVQDASQDFTSDEDDDEEESHSDEEHSDDDDYGGSHTTSASEQTESGEETDFVETSGTEGAEQTSGCHNRQKLEKYQVFIQV